MPMNAVGRGRLDAEKQKPARIEFEAERSGAVFADPSRGGLLIMNVFQCFNEPFFGDGFPKQFHNDV